MAKKQKNNTSKSQKEEKQDIYIEEKTVEINNEIQEDDIVTENVNKYEPDIAEVESQKVIDNAVKEYNGEITQEHCEERRIKVREKSEVSKIRNVNKKAIVIISSVIFAIILLFVAFSVVNKMNANIYRNIYLNEQDLSGMTSAEFTAYLKKEQEKLSKTSVKVFQDDEKILEIMPTDMDFEIDVVATQEQVFEYGRSSNILKNNMDILYAAICKKEFDVIYKYDVAKLSDIVKEIKESLNNKVVDDSYVVDEKEYKLIITKGKSGNTIDEEYVKNSIISSFANRINEYKLDTITGSPESLDVDVVYSKVKKEAKDAYIDKTSSVYKFVPHQVGYNLDKEALTEVLSKEENMVEGKVIEYKLTVVEPKIKTSDIKWDMYEYKISSYTTYFSTSDPNRVNNLRVALNLLNGKVIMPGETFSYNSVVGGATAAQGFKAAATFVGGRVVREVGGGICQTVSTLYNTALLANLEIVQRKAHSLPVAYVPGSRDATVYYPSIDFKFKNTREYPVKIVTSFNKNGNLTISLYGTKEENEYVISISSKILSTIAYKTQYVNDNTLAKGKQQVVQNGSNGYTSQAYITKKLNGKIVSTTLLSKDTYKAVNKIVKVGTKVVSSSSSGNKTNNSSNTSTNTNTNTGSSTSPDTSGTTTTPETSSDSNTLTLE